MADESFLYQQISRRLLEQIATGSFRPGQRLPSVRRLSQQFRVSVNTVVQSYRQLEAEGYLEIRPQSGAYVRAANLRGIPAPDGARYSLEPVEVSLSQQVLGYMELHAQPDILRLGIALPGPGVLPVERVMRALRAASRSAREAWDYTHPNGLPLLTHCLARRTLAWELPLAAEDHIVTAGAMEALSLALRSVTEPGDAVAVESPTYYGALLLLETHRRRVVEIPTHHEQGMDLAALEQVMARGEVTACMVSTNAQNPLGFTMDTGRKRALVALATRYRIPLIENDVWGDTVYRGAAPPAKAFDREGLVLYCNSFSKSLCPGLRIGWVAPGRFRDRLREIKQLSTIACGSLAQLALGELLESGFYHQHLRDLRNRLREQVQTTARELAAAFPADTRISNPSGGCVLWLRLPPGVDSTELFRRAAAAGIHVFPGAVFSMGDKHADYLRISAGNPVTPEVQRALHWLGRATAELAEQAAVPQD